MSKVGGGDAEFIATDTKSNDFSRSGVVCCVYDLLSGIGAELADCIEDPKKLETTRFEWLDGAKDDFEVFLRALVAKKHDADRESDFGVDYILREELLGEILRDEGVVLRIAEKGCDPLEGVEEAEKIRVGVPAEDFVFADGDAVARGQLRDDGRANAAFEMKVQLSLWERKKVLGERAFGHGGEISEGVGAGRRFSRQ